MSYHFIEMSHFRLQMLDHFNECIKLAKASRQEAIQMNVFTALLVGLKGLTDVKGTLGQDVKKSATSLIVVCIIMKHLF